MNVKILKSLLKYKCFLCNNDLDYNDSQLYCWRDDAHPNHRMHMLYDQDSDGFFGPNRIEIIYKDIVAVILIDKNIIGFYKFTVKKFNTDTKLIKNFQYKDIKEWLLKEDDFISKMDKHIGNLLVLL